MPFFRVRYWKLGNDDDDVDDDDGIESDELVNSQLDGNFRPPPPSEIALAALR